jgi:hypothetical protein
MSRSLPTQLLVMAGHGLTDDQLPLWARGPQDAGPVRQQDLGLSDQLTARLREWGNAWADRPPEQPRPWAGLNKAEWLQTGYRLARQLQAELPDVQVLVLDARDREAPVDQIR